jgi:hypothetical protein
VFGFCYCTGCSAAAMNNHFPNVRAQILCALPARAFSLSQQRNLLCCLPATPRTPSRRLRLGAHRCCRASDEGTALLQNTSLPLSRAQYGSIWKIRTRVTGHEQRNRSLLGFTRDEQQRARVEANAVKHLERGDVKVAGMPAICEAPRAPSR